MSRFKLPERLKKIRGDKTLVMVANDIGITSQSLGRYENGSRKPDSEVLYMIAEYYGVSCDYLVGLTDEPTPKKEKMRIAAIEYTGLSGETIDRLKEAYKNRPDETLIVAGRKYKHDFYGTLNNVLSSDDFYFLLDYIQELENISVGMLEELNGDDYIRLKAISQRLNIPYNNFLEHFYCYKIGTCPSEKNECEVYYHKISKRVEKLAKAFDKRMNASDCTDEEILAFFDMQGYEFQKSLNEEDENGKHNNTEE